MRTILIAFAEKCEELRAQTKEDSGRFAVFGLDYEPAEIAVNKVLHELEEWMTEQSQSKVPE